MSFEAVLGNKEFEMTLTGSKAFNFWGDMVTGIVTLISYHHYLKIVGNNKL
jgi:hypothetical protein